LRQKGRGAQVFPLFPCLDKRDNRLFVQATCQNTTSEQKFNFLGTQKSLSIQFLRCEYVMRNGLEWCLFPSGVREYLGVGLTKLPNPAGAF
jgi:hypothetical protein